MHPALRTDDGIDRTGRQTARAPDAAFLVDVCHKFGTFTTAGGVERLNRTAGERRKACQGIESTGRAAVDLRFARCDGLGIRTATLESASGALRLRQQRVDRLGVAPSGADFETGRR
jgi:hypothetical protein